MRKITFYKYCIKNNYYTSFHFKKLIFYLNQIRNNLFRFSLHNKTILLITLNNFWPIVDENVVK